MSETKKKRGQPTKKTPAVEAKLMECFELGMTDTEACEIVGITKATLNNWKKANNDFFSSIKLAKLKADGEVESALLKSAKGHKEGKNYYPPNPTSMIFWLKNRQRSKWRDRVDVEVKPSTELIVQAGQEKLLLEN